MSEVLLELKDIRKSLGGKEVLKGVDLQVYSGEFLSVLGPSGCGKTTALRIIAGLETPDGGDIEFCSQSMLGVPPEKRDISTIFQNYALFPHMTVEANVGYSLKIRRKPKEEIKEQVRKTLELVQLEGYEKRKPSQLSGGQKQRVAIARSLIQNPKLLLLDEPLGALDMELRRRMQTELKKLQEKLGITFIYITHDREEALNMSDRIALMGDGRIIKVGDPHEILQTAEDEIHGIITEINDGEVSFFTVRGSGSFKSDDLSLSVGMPIIVSLNGNRAKIKRGNEINTAAVEVLLTKAPETEEVR